MGAFEWLSAGVSHPLTSNVCSIKGGGSNKCSVLERMFDW